MEVFELSNARMIQGIKIVTFIMNKNKSPDLLTWYNKIIIYKSSKPIKSGKVFVLISVIIVIKIKIIPKFMKTE